MLSCGRMQSADEPDRDRGLCRQQTPPPRISKLDACPSRASRALLFRGEQIDLTMAPPRVAPPAWLSVGGEPAVDVLFENRPEQSPLQTCAVLRARGAPYQCRRVIDNQDPDILEPCHPKAGARLLHPGALPGKCL
jgi:hypothetical protein